MDDAEEDRSRASKHNLDRKPKKKKEKKKSSSSLSRSSESSKEERAKKRKKASRKCKSKKEKVSPEASNSKVIFEKTPLTVPMCAIKQPVPNVGPHVDLSSSKIRAPMTKEEYEKQQSTLKWITDPETGRKRLIRGSGEVVEEIVSRERHQAINRQATIADGNFFQAQANLKARSSYD